MVIAASEGRLLPALPILPDFRRGYSRGRRRSSGAPRGNQTADGPRADIGGVNASGIKSLGPMAGAPSFIFAGLEEIKLIKLHIGGVNASGIKSLGPMAGALSFIFAGLEEIKQSNR
jgi:hypothetical protein